VTPVTLSVTKIPVEIPAQQPSAAPVAPAPTPVITPAHIHNVSNHAKVHVGGLPAMQHAGLPVMGIPVVVPAHIQNVSNHAKVHVEGLHVMDAGISTATLILMKTPVEVLALGIPAII
jgi:hypothetical protein